MISESRSSFTALSKALFALIFVLGLALEISAIVSPFKFSRRCDASTVCAGADLTDSPFCGTDGRSYDTRCDLKRVNCLGKRVKVHHEGVCNDAEKCALDRSFQMALFAQNEDVFVPKCNDTDGSYNRIQCHKSTDYCWCVSPEGRPLLKSSTLNAMPDCDEFASAKVGRRSSRRRTHAERADSKSCSNLDRATFNSNLMKLFVKDYGRVPEALRNQRNIPSNLTTEKQALHWKFGELDADGNDLISEGEIQGLTRVVRRWVKPQACAAQFPDVCDSDVNAKIGRDEWILCLGNNELSKVAIQHVKASYRILHTPRRRQERPPPLRNIASSAFNLLRNG